MKKDTFAHKGVPKNIICISSVDWFPIPTRKQQVMSRLPGYHNILYVEPPITLLSPIKDRGLTFKLSRFMKGNRKIKDNIIVYCPPPILPFGNIFKWINKINQWWIAAFIKRAAQNAEMDNPLVWTYMPNSYDLVKKMNYKALVYDCVDEHSEYRGFINKNTMLTMERELIKKCDIVFVTAEGLYDSKSKYNKNTYLITNGVNFELFNSVQDEKIKPHGEVKNLPKPVVGFIGVIQEWIDLDLIFEIAQNNPGLSVLMVGPVGAGVDVEKLKNLTNVYFVGAKKPEILPYYIKIFDVCINPFRQSNLTKNVSPLKFYEYLATGKPIVTVDMPAVREFSDCVLIAKDNREFIYNITEAIEKDTEELKQKRIEKGKENSWEEKVTTMLDILDERLGGSVDDEGV